jgi:hypothetical protein
MLPFLKKPIKDAGVMVVERRPDDSSEPQEDQGLMAAAKDLLSAIEMKDHKKMAMALRAAFELLDSEPHEEGPHISQENE